MFYPKNFFIISQWRCFRFPQQGDLPGRRNGDLGARQMTQVVLA